MILYWYISINENLLLETERQHFWDEHQHHWRAAGNANRAENIESLHYGQTKVTLTELRTASLLLSLLLI